MQNNWLLRSMISSSEHVYLHVICCDDGMIWGLWKDMHKERGICPVTLL